MLINPGQTINISPLHRLQWDESKKQDLIIYPEGTVELNASSAEILRLCDDSRNLIQIIKELESKIFSTGLAKDITSFLEVAFKKGWEIN